MSYDVALLHKGIPVRVPRHSDGGTYVLGGIDRAELNVTYNYDISCLGPNGLWELHGLTGDEALPRLRGAVLYLGTVRDPDYWAGTPGNAGYTLSILLGWAALYPRATFRVE